MPFEKLVGLFFNDRGALLLRPLFRYVVLSGIRELFTAAALLLVIGIALFTSAWVIDGFRCLSCWCAAGWSEYRHELEIAIEPFKAYYSVCSLLPLE